MKIHFTPSNLKINISHPQSVLEAANRAGLYLTSLCGGRGKCGKCKIRFISGKISSLTSIEREVLSQKEINRGFRLACQSVLKGDAEIFIPSLTLFFPQQLKISRQGKGALQVDPIIKKYILKLIRPTLNDTRSDVERVKDEMMKTHGININTIDAIVIKSLSEYLRNSDWCVTIYVRNREVIKVGRVDNHTTSYGLAVDLGSTNIAIFLLDLLTGETLNAWGVTNPQVVFGEDIISRVQYIIEDKPDKYELRDKVVGTINKTIKEMCKQIKISSCDILEATIVGNTAMHHIFLDLPLEQLVTAPFICSTTEPWEIKARDLGINICQGGYVYFPPLIGGFIGSDHTAMILASRLYQKKKICLGIDIGTNTEITLKTNEGLYACSCASGPAFEGGSIEYGMKAGPGAIHKVKINPKTFIASYQTIDRSPPVGLCGSGIIDAVSEMVKTGTLNSRGILKKGIKKVTKSQGKEMEFLLVTPRNTADGLPIVMTQKDTIQIQLAKGAIQTGINILLHQAQVKTDMIQEILLAGAFGNYLSPQSAVNIGMLPHSVKKIKNIGNAAGRGSQELLLSKKKRKLAEKISREINYIELSVHPYFSRTFAQSLKFPNL